VGDFRGPDGNYRDFTGLTVDAFRRCGLALYNEAILVTPLGTVPVRTAAQFPVSRKLGKTHQNLYVFPARGGALPAAGGGIMTDHPSAEPRVSAEALAALEANARGLMDANPDLRTTPMRLHPREFLGMLAEMRTLERELAEARRESSTPANVWKALCQETEQRVSALLAERDEARRELVTAREMVRTMETHLREADDVIFERFAQKLAHFHKANGGDGYLGGEGEDSGDVADWCAASAIHVAGGFVDERDAAQAMCAQLGAEAAAYREVIQVIYDGWHMSLSEFDKKYGPYDGSEGTKWQYDDTKKITERALAASAESTAAFIAGVERRAREAEREACAAELDERGRLRRVEEARQWSMGSAHHSAASHEYDLAQECEACAAAIRQRKEGA
jgi:hypothetical protein